VVDDRITLRKKRREKYVELKMAALAELERRGYEVRGKTPGQIRKILKRPPKRLTNTPDQGDRAGTSQGIPRAPGKGFSRGFTP
jgi:hypothetical protein